MLVSALLERGGCTMREEAIYGFGASPPLGRCDGEPRTATITTSIAKTPAAAQASSWGLVHFLLEGACTECSSQRRMPGERHAAPAIRDHIGPRCWQASTSSSPTLSSCFRKHFQAFTFQDMQCQSVSQLFELSRETSTFGTKEDLEALLLAGA